MVARADRLVTVFGGSGFLGRHTVRALVKRGWRVRVAVRRPDLAGHLQPIGAVGQIHAVQANLRFPDSVARAVANADAVVNLVGILYETSRQSFAAVQADGAAAVARAAAAAGIDALVQVSALGADADSPSAYARSKAAGEQAVLAERPSAVVMRPSIVFGPEDDFFNRFAGLARFAPALPLIGGGETRFEPVFVGDVAEAIARALDGAAAPGRIYELGGPQARSFRELLEMMLRETHQNRMLIPVPFGLARLKARILGLAPKPLLTVDQVELLTRDNVVSEAARAEKRTLEGLGIEGQTLAAVLPTYLWRYRKGGQFAAAVN
jgi:NADH dehydrogenase